MTKQLDTSGFTGTSRWVRFSPLTRAVLTDGTMYVAEQTNNFGLMQDIGIDLQFKPKVRRALEDGGLVVVEIDTEGFGLRYEDGNGKKIYGYPLIGYPELKIRLFASMASERDPCIYLPSEY